MLLISTQTIKWACCIRKKAWTLALL